VYQGYVKFYNTGPATGPVIVLATGASVNLVLEPIYSSSVWGAGWYNAGVAHYADAAIRYEGTVDFEVQGNANVWDFMEKWISNERAYPRSLDISPDGARVYQYRTSDAYGVNYDTYGAWNASASFSTSEGSFVTCSAGVVAFRRNELDPAGGLNYSNYSYIKQKQGVIASSCALLSTTNPLNPATVPGESDNVNPIPFWRTNAVLCRDIGGYSGPFDNTKAADGGLETVEWSIDVAQNNVILYTCNGQRLPTAFLQGPMDATGSVILYNPNGVFDPIIGPAGTGTLTTPYLYAEITWFVVEITTTAAGTHVYLELPAVVVESDDYSIPGPDAVVNRTFSVKGLAGRCNSDITMPPFIMSTSSGTFDPP
jgi:hypothetical protein